ncbi:Alpha-1,3-mannosyltransferase-like protein [Coemansia sp. RSA 552]|nr:Alpha-1,3-mannosyltransferase-like protein [Coemansia sp. RSA 552]
MSQSLNIAFVHPNLGIGGAERLVVDSALSMQQRGHKVVIYTMHHDLAHCFEETRDGTLDVRVGGSWLVPQSIFGHGHILCTVLRSLGLARKLTMDREQYDVVFVDQLSAPIPLLKYAHAHILFYCHFPDYLSATRGSLWRQIYRMPFDLLEEVTTGEADQILVNSRFTQETFRKAFPHLSTVPKVLMPGLNLAAYDAPVQAEDPALALLRTHKKLVLSINRFERKKDIDLGIRAFAQMPQRGDACLVVAGGWDVQVPENTAYLRELDGLARGLGLRTRTIAPRGVSAQAYAQLPEDAERVTTFAEADASKDGSEADVVFLPSFSENQRAYLLSMARCVVYTPSNEHLGIVPLEAMYMRVPVVAVDSGGPRETVQHTHTGYLCEPTPSDFAAAIAKVLNASEEQRTAMGEAGRARVAASFGLDAYGAKLEEIIQDMQQYPQTVSTVFGVVMTLFILLCSGTAILCATLF